MAESKKPIPDILSRAYPLRADSEPVTEIAWLNDSDFPSNEPELKLEDTRRALTDKIATATTDEERVALRRELRTINTKLQQGTVEREDGRKKTQIGELTKLPTDILTKEKLAIEKRIRDGLEHPQASGHSDTMFSDLDKKRHAMLIQALIAQRKP